MNESPELRALVEGYFASFTVGDAAWVDAHVLDGAELRLIGTNADEWLKGSSAFSLFRHEAAEASGSLRAEVSEVEAYSQGSVGWGAGLVRFTVADGLSANARFSVVFAAIDGEWRVVSSHTSVPVPDDEAFAPE